MIDWIIKHINPLGTEKKSRGSLYRFIARVLGQVRDDAVMSFRAHFPLLADSRKLREHGKALFIPEIDGDTEDEYRARVSGASFFLSRAGERAYILDQLRAHFGSRFASREEFLKVFVKIVDLDERDRKWVPDFLDTILDPNVFISVAEWFMFSDSAVTGELHHIAVCETNIDTIAIDEHTGTSSAVLSGFSDAASVHLFHNGTFRRDGTERHSSRGRHSCAEIIRAGYRKHHFHNGIYRRNGAIKHDGMILIPL